MALIYKTLFEIKLLHEYFLTRKDGTTIFSEPDQPARLAFLREEFNKDQEPVNVDIDFEFPESLRARYESLSLRLLPTYSGCRVVIRVLPKTLADQSLVFEPAVALHSAEDIVILITRKTLAYDVYTNSRVSRSLPSTYLFLNANVPGPKSFPFLTNNVPPQDIAFSYEQGELSLSGPTIQEYYRQGVADVWHDVTGNAFANETDRVLLPSSFHYYFPNTTNLVQASFVLTDRNGDEVVNFDTSDASGLKQKVGLDFSGKVKTIPLTDTSFEDVTYTLKVTGNNGLEAEHTIVFTNDLTRTKPWGVIMLRPEVTNADFNLLANDGFLFRRRDALGVWTEAPVFEIPIKSRLAYWRFIHHKGKALDVSAPLMDYVGKEGNVLVTLTPRAASRSWFSLRKEMPAGTQYVPNPVAPEIKLETDRRLFFDVVVPESDLFPEVP
jgi:hypothetical protein